MESGENPQNPNMDDFSLRDNSRIAVIGGGPAGSFFSYFLLAMAERVSRSLLPSRKRESELFTGSASYSEVFRRMFHPFFWGRLFGFMALEIWPLKRKKSKERKR